MNDSINKQLIFLEIALALYPGLAKEKVMRGFLISNVPACNTKLCRWQPLARDLLVVWGPM